MKYRIGSFNMYKLSFQSDKEIKKNLDIIADIIAKEEFDIVALQEVLSKSALKQIMLRLGANWDYRWEQPKKTIAQQAAEGYAYLWNTRTMELSWTRNEENFTYNKPVEPHIYNQYRIDRSKFQKELIRNPYYGRFKPKACFCEIRLINTHIRFSNKENDVGDITARQNEFRILTECIYPQISNRVYGNNMPSYTILLGDYNLNLSGSMSSSSGLIPAEIIEVDDNGKIQRIQTIQKERTTLQRKTNEKEQIEGFANNYDHFSHDMKFSEREVSANVRSINTVEKYCENDFEKHRLEVSDHVPIVMEFGLK